MNTTTPPVELDSGLALVGQVAMILVLIIALILACAWVFRRLGGLHPSSSKLLNVVGSVAVGQRERVVIVAVGETWLVLGVASGQVTKLHEMPAQALPEPVAQSFASRLQHALKQQSNPSEKH